MSITVKSKEENSLSEYIIIDNNKDDFFGQKLTDFDQLIQHISYYSLLSILEKKEYQISYSKEPSTAVTVLISKGLPQIQANGFSFTENKTNDDDTSFSSTTKDRSGVLIISDEATQEITALKKFLKQYNTDFENAKVSLQDFIKEEPQFDNSIILLVSIVVSAMAAYKSVRGTFGFFESLGGPAALDWALGLLIGVVPSTFFYSKSMNIVISKIYQRKLNWNRAQLISNLTLGALYGAGNYGIMLMSEANIGWRAALHWDILLVGLMLGAHKSDWVYRFLSSQSEYMFNSSTEDLLKNSDSFNKRLKTNVTYLQPYVSPNVEGRMHPIEWWQHSFEALKKTNQQSVSSDVITAYYNTGLEKYNFPGSSTLFLFFGLIMGTNAVLFNYASIFSNVKGVQGLLKLFHSTIAPLVGHSFIKATLDFVFANPIASLVVASIFSLAVFSLNMKDTKRLLLIPLTAWSKLKITFHNDPKKYRQAWLKENLNTLVIGTWFWSAAQATQGVYYQFIASEKEGINSMLLLMLTCIPVAFLMTSTKQKSLQSALQAFCDRFKCCQRDSKQKVEAAFDQQIFCFTKEYNKKIERYNKSIGSLTQHQKSTTGAEKIDRRSAMKNLQSQINQILQNDNEVPNLRLKFIDLMVCSCAKAQSKLELLKFKLSSQSSSEEITGSPGYGTMTLNDESSKLDVEDSPYRTIPEEDNKTSMFYESCVIG
jgi:hypothetical protein